MALLLLLLVMVVVAAQQIFWCLCASSDHFSAYLAHSLDALVLEVVLVLVLEVSEVDLLVNTCVVELQVGYYLRTEVEEMICASYV